MLLGAWTLRDALNLGCCVKGLLVGCARVGTVLVVFCLSECGFSPCSSCLYYAFGV